MKFHKWLFVALTSFVLLFSFATEESRAQTCSSPVMLDWDRSVYSSIQSAYDQADSLGLTDFTLQLATDGLIQEDLLFDLDVSVVLEGGWDCLFSTKNNNLTTSIAGSMIILAGTVTPSNIGLKAEPSCTPGDPNNFPGNPEICDGLDNNCDGIADDGLGFDEDGDGHYATDSCTLTYTPADDCDDLDPDNFPGNPEICDGQDNNCDGQVDEGLTATDGDGDGYYALGSCLDGTIGNDCNDNDPSINPGAIEYFGDFIDQDCDGRDLTYTPAYPVPYPGYNEYDCLGCHGGVDVVNNFLQQIVAAPDSYCAGCNESQVNEHMPGQYGDTVKTSDD